MKQYEGSEFSEKIHWMPIKKTEADLTIGFLV